MSVACIACESRQTKLMGKLPVFTPDYLGKPIGSVDAGSLYRCENCSLSFRWPMPDPDTLLEYYKGLEKDDWWPVENSREVWDDVAAQLKNIPAPQVLDIGCFRGNMLRQIGIGLNCFGVEPSPSARSEAEAHGITVIADSIDSLKGEQRRFGAITLIDVAEHLPHPLEAFQILANLLVDEGKLILFTGSTDALSWRFARQDYWYCALPEHVAFFRPSWFDWAAPRLGFHVTEIKRLPFEPVTFQRRADEALKNVSFVSYRRLKKIAGVGSLLPKVPLIGRMEHWQSCWWTSARDHILVTMTKNTARI